MSVETIWHQFLLFRIRLFWSIDRYRYQYEVSENKLRKKRTRLTQIKFSAKERTNTYWLFRLSPNFLSIHSFNLLSKQISIFLSFFLSFDFIYLSNISFCVDNKLESCLPMMMMEADSNRFQDLIFFRFYASKFLSRFHK